MATIYLHRLIVVCPAARLVAVGAWWAANVDASDDASAWPALNPSGDPSQPLTHRWCSTALTESLLRAVIVRVCQIAGVTPPTVGTWNGWTRQQKRTWLDGVRDQLFTQTGIWLDLCGNDELWNNPEAVLTRLTLKRRALVSRGTP